jgi:hypothetical protein
MAFSDRPAGLKFAATVTLNIVTGLMPPPAAFAAHLHFAFPLFRAVFIFDLSPRCASYRLPASPV